MGFRGTTAKPWPQQYSEKQPHSVARRLAASGDAKQQTFVMLFLANSYLARGSALPLGTVARLLPRSVPSVVFAFKLRAVLLRVA